MFSIKRWVRRKWWQFRHKVYYHEVLLPPPISPTGGDDTTMIQSAINEATREPEWFRDIYAAYQRKWYRFLLKKPVLNDSVRFRSGTYTIGSSLVMSSPLVIDSNVSIQGQGAEHTIIEMTHDETP